MSLVVNDSTVKEIQALVASGDVSLSEAREKFENKAGRPTTLDDSALIVALALTDDDDDELLYMTIQAVEKGEFKVVPISDDAA